MRIAVTTGEMVAERITRREAVRVAVRKGEKIVGESDGPHIASPCSTVV